MLTLRPANERGHVDIGWLDSRFSFSFSDYYDPEWMGFRTLRVINDDLVEPARGFGMHPHRDMEIVSVVVDGELEHKDSMGNGSVLVPGDVQRMTAGTGVMHSEQNPSPDTTTRLLQIWIIPEKRGLTPGYEQKFFDDEALADRLRVVASRDGRDGSVTIHQDAAILRGKLSAGVRVEHPLAAGRHAWVQLISGSAVVNGKSLSKGDGMALSEESQLLIEAQAATDLLVFDLG